MDKEALWIAFLLFIKCIKSIVSDYRYDLLDGLEQFLKLLLTLIRILLLPLLLLPYALFSMRSNYKKIKTDPKAKKFSKKLLGVV